MSTLLLRLAAPLQSWGTDSKFDKRRETKREPTKSGVIGLLAAVLGRRRDEPVDDLAALKFGVRIEQPGQLVCDFQTARKKDSKNPFVTKREYLADAVFLVGLEGDRLLLNTLETAVREPVFPLYLGRRSCPPAGKISLGVNDKSLEESLYEAPWLAGRYYHKKSFIPSSSVRLTLAIDDETAGYYRRRDYPISFNQKHRKYIYRYIVDTPNAVPVKAVNQTEHDVFSAVGEVT